MNSKVEIMTRAQLRKDFEEAFQAWKVNFTFEYSEHLRCYVELEIRSAFQAWVSSYETYVGHVGL